ncbi:MAG: hypothetical protein EOP55_05835 [Sphingobacteriales bacterium]|nr:MAG: hypothetical protein EOP55_05835 [Sphingobacteriales bacterium]
MSRQTQAKKILIYSLEISDDALTDVFKILDYYDEISEKLSNRFEFDFNSRIKYLSGYPENFQIRYLKKMRVVPLTIFPYGIHFYIKDDTIFVVAVFHYSLSPKKWKRG